uniref:Uncharacterized protein n=1 Tax=Biomphalaria glabrata TaxID=6526 RepID=A0A2C9L2A2_BIOGL
MVCVELFIFALVWAFFLPALEACGKGWFGEACQFKCHCQSDCDKEGLCIGNNPRCENLWFGTRCQYQDLSTISGATITTNVSQWLTDRNIQTCNNDTNLQSVTIVWNTEYWFTWMRIVLKPSAHLKSIDVQFNQHSTSQMLNCTKFLLNTSSPTLEIHCTLEFLVRQITITAAADLCDIYISGGVNFALRQMVCQSSNYSYSKYYALHAVDGDMNTFSHTEHEPRPYLFVTLPKPRLVNRIVLYNRMFDAYNVSVGERLKNFELQGLDENNSTEFSFKDSNTSPLYNYTVVIAGKRMNTMLVNASSADTYYGAKRQLPVLTIRELEIYGECLPGTWGLYCNQSCPSYCPVTCTQEEGSCHLILEGEIYRLVRTV